MKDKYEIPIWNHINFFIFYELFDSFNRNGEDLKVSELLKRVEPKTGINKSLKDFYQFVNSGNVFSLLYTNLVIPKEIFDNKELGEHYFLSFDEKFENYFEILKGKDCLTSNFKFLNKLRNSIAHINFEWDEDRKEIKLWNNYRGSINFEVKSDLNRLTNFCLRLSRFISENQDKLDRLNDE